MNETAIQRRCDHCNKPVEVVGKNEPEYRHLSGSVFCQTTVATVQGRRTPRAKNGSSSEASK